MGGAVLVSLTPQPSAIVIGAVIAAALATLLLTAGMWWPTIRRFVWKRRMALVLWRNKRKTSRQFPTVKASAWFHDVEITTLWSALRLKKTNRRRYTSEEPGAPFPAYGLALRQALQAGAQDTDWAPDPSPKDIRRLREP